MSLRAVIDVTTRLMSDGEYRNRLINDPEGAFAEFNLTEEEREALRRRDRWMLEECGLEEWTARWVSALR